MKQDKALLFMLALCLVGLAGMMLLVGITFCQVYILATYQGLPPVWQQALFFALLLVAGGVTVAELSVRHRQD